MELVPPDALWSAAFKCIGLPDFLSETGAWGISKALEAFWKKRGQEAHIRICDEMRKGNITLTQASLTNDHFAAFVRMAQAVRDSASHEAIRLMAKVMVGQIQRDRLYADDFIKFANIISGLSRDEILILSLLYDAHKKMSEKNDPNRLWSELVNLVVPGHFESEDYVLAILTGLSRSGLVIAPQNNLLSIGTYVPSPLMDELVRLADFQDALRAEGVRMPDDDDRQEPHL